MQRGDVRVAIQALERAAELSADTTRRAQCLLKASELAFEIGWNGIVVNLLKKAETLELSRRDRVWLTWFREAAQRQHFRRGSAKRDRRQHQNRRRRRPCAGPALGPSDERLVGRARRGSLQARHQSCRARANFTSVMIPRFVLIVAMTDPIDRGAFVIERLHHFAANLRDDARTAHLLGLAAIQIGDFDLAERFLNSAIAA